MNNVVEAEDIPKSIATKSLKECTKFKLSSVS